MRNCRAVHGMLLLAFVTFTLVSGAGRRARAQPAAAPGAPPMFVFGSSYVDTGNVPNTDSSRPYPWSKPYGSTWPGTPSGRYSNGRVLTDAVATSLNLGLPTSSSKLVNGVKSKSGVNFASGGSGVLADTGFPPISSQIDSFQSIASLYTAQELASAIVLYCPAGDDYFNYLTVQKQPISGIYPLTVNVGKQISNDLVRLYALGLRKFAVAYLPPTGCLPIATSTNQYAGCNDTWTSNVANPHNGRIFKNVLGLRHYFKNGTILLVDLFSAFPAAQSSIGSSLKPCCVGSTPTARCGTIGIGGRPAYILCPNPTSQFYWDDINPSEAGWQAVAKQIQPSLSTLLK